MHTPLGFCRALFYLVYGLACASFHSPVYAIGCSDQSGAGGFFCQLPADPGTNRSKNNDLRHVGNPIDVITGAKQQREIDFQAVGSPLHLSRYYYSGRSDSHTGLGAGWRHSYQVSLVRVDETRLRIQQASGRWVEFKRIDSSSTATLYMASATGDGYIIVADKPSWHLPDGRVLHFNGSMLIRIEYPDNTYLQVRYKQQRLHSVSDSAGRELRFNYLVGSSQLPDFEATAKGLFPGYLSHVQLPSGERIDYSYDQNANLARAYFSDKDKRTYSYAMADYPSHLTTINHDYNGEKSISRWQYNSAGKVNRYDAPNPAHSLSIVYAQSEGEIAETLVNYDSGKQRRYRYQTLTADEPSRVLAVFARDCEQCADVHLAPVKATPQQAGDVLDDVHNDALGKKRSKMRQSVQGGLIGTVTIEAIKGSLDQLGTVSIDGVEHQFRFETNRFGELVDISIGNTSLSEIIDKWQAGLMQRCDFAPLFERSQQRPKPVQACVEDMVYLIELERHVEDLSQSHGLPDINDLMRSANGEDVGVPCMVNPFESCEELERNFELAQLSSCAYRQVIRACGSQWQAVTPASLNLPVHLFNDESFASSLFYNRANNEYVLAFRGTDNLGDWKDNVLQATGRTSSQYEASMVLAKTLQSLLPEGSLSFTGHSLGGGLATTAALAIDSTATVFNPAALHPDTALALGLDYEDAKDQVNVTTVHGDLLTRIQEPKTDGITLFERHRAPGQHNVLAAPRQAWIEKQQAASSLFTRAEGIILHAIDAVMETQTVLLEEECGTIPERA